MKFSQAKQGRVFIIRLEDGDIIHEQIENFAKEQSVKAASLIILGGADKGSCLVTGPEKGRGVSPVVPKEQLLNNVNEIAGTGTIFPDENNEPVLHMHMACGRGSDTITGCIRNGVKVWHIAEVILFELTDTNACRVMDSEIGFKLLEP